MRPGQRLSAPSASTQEGAIWRINELNPNGLLCLCPREFFHLRERRINAHSLLLRGATARRPEVAFISDGIVSAKCRAQLLDARSGGGR